MEKINTVEGDIAIIGGSLGAVAAAQACLERGYRVVMTEQYPWIGGQVTNQALCALDEYHDPISEGGVGYSRRYGQFRQALRDYYTRGYKLSRFGSEQKHFNAGNSMNSMVVAEPTAARQVIEDLFADAVADGRLQVYTEHVPVSAEVEGRRIQSVVCRSLREDGARLKIRARFFLSGDEVGDLYPLLDIPYMIGSESHAEYGEPHAPELANPEAVQSFTYCIAVEYAPGEDHTIDKPEDYEYWKALHGHLFFLDAPGARGSDPALMFRAKKGRNELPIPPAFYYRSVVDQRNFDDPRLPRSRTIINTTGNDYFHGNFIDSPEKDRIQAEARALSRAYLYWIQTEAPRDDGGHGYPEIRPLPELTGTPDGIAMGPYIREGRRLKAYTVVTENSISAAVQLGARAQPYRDSAGLGCFIIDIHRRVGGEESISQMARPYQIPLSALITPELDNFAVAGKGIGVTQIANGAYRLHNIEWGIGEAAGEFAAFALDEGLPSRPLEGLSLKACQSRLVKSGVPLVWFEDLSYEHPAFEAVQMLAICGLLPLDGRHLRLNPFYSVARCRKLADHIFDRLKAEGVDYGDLRQMVVEMHCTRFTEMLRHVYLLLERVGWPEAFLADTAFSLADIDLDVLFQDIIPEGMHDKEVSLSAAR